VRAEGLAALTLRDVAAKVGMRPPSLYSYFPSKNAIYDAMFLQGGLALLRRCEAAPEFGKPVDMFLAHVNKQKGQRKPRRRT
jgi:AcrR family transcriptional regulator